MGVHICVCLHLLVAHLPGRGPTRLHYVEKTFSSLQEPPLVSDSVWSESAKLNNHEQQHPHRLSTLCLQPAICCCTQHRWRKVRYLCEISELGKMLASNAIKPEELLPQNLDAKILLLVGI